MELYVLDGAFRRIRVIDRFESLVWTERWKEIGDFELTIESTPITRNNLHVGDRLALNESDRVMTIETIEDRTDDEGREVLNVTGRSFEAILEDRIATKPLVANGETYNWTIANSPKRLVHDIFRIICIEGRVHPGDIIPRVVETSNTYPMYPGDTIAEDINSISIEISPTTVYDAIKQICDIYNLGFRFLRFADDGVIHFNVHTGSDRTTAKTRNPVIFSPELDSLSDVTAYQSVAGFKNTAYVFSDKGSLMVYGGSTDPSVSGFERRVLKVDATDLGDITGAELTAGLKQRGLEALASHQSLTAFDGKIPENGPHKYNVDYRLGDIVEMRNSDGAVNHMRVTEQIFISDSSGENSYPTLAFELFLTPGSWSTWDQNQVWNTATKMWEQA